MWVVVGGWRWLTWQIDFVDLVNHILLSIILQSYIRLRHSPVGLNLYFCILKVLPDVWRILPECTVGGGELRPCRVFSDHPVQPPPPPAPPAGQSSPLQPRPWQPEHQGRGWPSHSRDIAHVCHLWRRTVIANSRWCDEDIKITQYKVSNIRDRRTGWVLSGNQQCWSL